MTSLTNIASKIIDRGSKETIDGHTKHWWQHEINNARADGYKRGYASGKKVMRDAAAKVWGQTFDYSRGRIMGALFVAAMIEKMQIPGKQK